MTIGVQSINAHTVLKKRKCSMAGVKVIKHSCAECAHHKCSCVCAKHCCDGSCQVLHIKRKCTIKACVNFKLDKCFKGSED